MVKLEQIHKKFGNVEVLKGVDLKVNKGEVVVLMGPSGSGKSTLLRTVNLLEVPQKGKITIGEVSVEAPNIKKQEKLKLRRQSTMVFQQYNLFQHKTAIENITEGLIQVKGVSKAEAINIAYSLLEKVGLKEKANNFPNQLSGGQQQRVAIARALALSPQLILFDEPTSALDPEKVGEVLEVLRALAEEGLTMLVVTHEVAFARQVADRIIYMEDGRVIEEGKPEEILYNPKNDLTKRFLNLVSK